MVLCNVDVLKKRILPHKNLYISRAVCYEAQLSHVLLVAMRQTLPNFNLILKSLHVPSLHNEDNCCAWMKKEHLRCDTISCYSIPIHFLLIAGNLCSKCSSTSSNYISLDALSHKVVIEIN